MIDRTNVDYRPFTRLTLLSTLINNWSIALGSSMASSQLQLIDNHLRSLVSNNDDEILKLNTIFEAAEPMSPPFNDVIRMDDEFQKQSLIDGIFRNLVFSNAPLSYWSWKELIKFCGQDFTQLTCQIGLQILFVLSKLDLGELNVNDQTTFDQLINGTLRKLSIDNFKMERLDVRQSEEIKVFIKQTVIIKAFRHGLSQFFGDIEEDFILNTISKMVIYSSTAPLELRGCCLRDGIYMNLLRICPEVIGIQNHKADLMTLAAHETAHHLARMKDGNYNFSSPSFGMDNGGLRKEGNPEKPNKNLELGRFVEMCLFNCQPNWAMSEPKAAASFLERSSDQAAELPLFKKEDKSIHARRGGSVSAGMDLVDSLDIC